MLFKGGEALERLAHLDAVVLDKTGTLTVGRPVLEAIHTTSDCSKADLLRWAAAAEERSNHPLAHAVIDYARQRGLSWPAAADVQIVPGRGLTAIVDGHDCILGNQALFGELFIPFPQRSPLRRTASRGFGWRWTGRSPDTSTRAMRCVPMPPEPSPRSASRSRKTAKTDCAW